MSRGLRDTRQLEAMKRVRKWEETVIRVTTTDREEVTTMDVRGIEMINITMEEEETGEEIIEGQIEDIRAGKQYLVERKVQELCLET